MRCYGILWRTGAGSTCKVRDSRTHGVLDGTGVSHGCKCRHGTALHLNVRRRNELRIRKEIVDFCHADRAHVPATIRPCHVVFAGTHPRAPCRAGMLPETWRCELRRSVSSRPKQIPSFDSAGTPVKPTQLTPFVRIALGCLRLPPQPLQLGLWMKNCRLLTALNFRSESIRPGLRLTATAAAVTRAEGRRS